MQIPRPICVKAPVVTIALTGDFFPFAVPVRCVFSRFFFGLKTFAIRALENVPGFLAALVTRKETIAVMVDQFRAALWTFHLKTLLIIPLE
jgi:hypothetical protein